VSAAFSDVVILVSDRKIGTAFPDRIAGFTSSGNCAADLEERTQSTGTGGGVSGNLKVALVLGLSAHRRRAAWSFYPVVRR